MIVGISVLASRQPDAPAAVAAFCLSDPADPGSFSGGAERLSANWHKEKSVEIWHLTLGNVNI